MTRPQAGVDRGIPLIALEELSSPQVPPRFSLDVLSLATFSSAEVNA